MEYMKESVRETSLRIIEEKGSCYNSDVAKILRIPPQSVGAFLSHNYREWGLLKKSTRDRRGRCVYEKDTVATAHFEHENNLVGINETKKSISDKIRESALRLIEERGYVLSENIARTVGISRGSVAMCLHLNYKKWGLRQLEDGKDLSERRHKYVKDLDTNRPYKCKTPSIPNLAYLFSEEERSLEGVYETRKESSETVNCEALLIAELRADIERKARKKTPLTVPDFREAYHGKTHQKLENNEENLYERLERALDDLHKRQYKVSLVEMKKAVEEELDRRADMNIMEKTMKIYDEGVRKGKYFWNSRGGYSTSRKSI